MNRRNKKGQFYGPFLVAFTLFVLIDAYIVLSAAFAIGEDKGPTTYVGERQLELLSTYAGTGKVGLYIDQSAKLSFYHALKTIRDTGGFESQDAACGNYHGFSRWNGEDGTDCTPTQRDVESALSSLFSADFNTRLRAHPAIQKTTSFASEAASVSDEFAGIIDIPQTAKLKCARGLLKKDTCKLHSEAIDKLLEATQLLDEGEYFVIKSATRSKQKQGELLLKNLKGGPTACGARTIKRDFAWNKNVAPIPRKDDYSSTAAYEEVLAEYVPKAKAYLRDHPEIEKQIKTMDYPGCPHLSARAVDLHLIDKNGKKDENRPRIIMCSVGWVNFGGEHWHFEYGTSSWNKEEPTPEELDVADVGDPSQGDYHTSCYYGIAEGKLRMYG